MRDAIAIPLFLIMLFGALALLGLTQNFGARCERAGFKGAAHERCVMRLRADGPMYPENVGFKP